MAFVFEENKDAIKSDSDVDFQGSGEILIFIVYLIFNRVELVL